MKVIKLKSVKLSQNPDEDPVGYGDLIRTIVRGIDVREGADIEDIKKRLRIIDALDATKDDTLKLEDADAEYLVGKVKANKWAIVSPGIVQFHDDIVAAVKG